MSNHVAILIVGFRNPQDISACLHALSRATPEPSFDIFVCENGAPEAYRRLVTELTAENGPCRLANGDLSEPLYRPGNRLAEISQLELSNRPARVTIGLAVDNLGYAGGLNVWLERLLELPGWDGVWVLNPDTEPDARALESLVERAAVSGKGMIGSTLVPAHQRDRVHCRGGLHWQKLLGRSVLIGFQEQVESAHDIHAIETALDSVSGASMYVTCACLRRIGLLDEIFFLYYEDFDWALRAKACGLGYASGSLVPHKLGTTIGSALTRAARSPLSVYLEYRNRIHFVRKHFPLLLPLTAAQSLAYSLEFLVAGSPKNFLAALKGLWAAAMGETGPGRK